MSDDKQVEVLAPAGTDAGTGTAMEEKTEPPVVARLVVEIRSDGSRTIARGAIQDANLGREVQIRAEGATPLALAMSLVRSLVKAPFIGGAFGGALKALAGKRGGRG
jgi:hypothetical protein